MKTRVNRAPQPVDRRAFLAGSAAIAGGYLITACQQDDPDGEGAESPEPAENQGEAPMLAERVEAGELPPVEDRLPAEALVVEPNDRIGVYGGDWNYALLGPSDTPALQRTVSYEGLTRWNLEFDDVMPNVARDIEVSSDGTQITFMLREGMKWSDGADFTADDVVFAYNDVLLNTDIYPAPPSIFLTGDEVVELEKVDDYTIRFSSSQPHGLLIQLLATPNATQLTEHPRHYLEQFHLDYNPEAEALAADESEADWVTLFLAKSDRWQNVELPRIHPWVPTNALGDGQQFILERNPYYWKTDPEGSQLPYLDRVVFELVEDREVVILKAGSGELDMQDRHTTSAADRPFLAQNQESGDYSLFTMTPSGAVSMSIAFNLNAQDQDKREIFQNKDFRIGLSHAINREEIINLVYQQQGEPYQVAPRPDSLYYDEEMATQYTEFNVDLANEHLDNAGLSERDGDGMRLDANGNPFSFPIDVVAGSTNADSLEIVRENWREVGIDIEVRPIERSLFDERRQANEHEASSWQGEGAGGLEPPLRPDWWFPSNGESVNYAPLWMEWYQTAGASGEEPPEEVQTQMQIYRGEVLTGASYDAVEEAMRRVLEISKEMFYHIGISLRGEAVGVVHNDFHNVPEWMPLGFLYPQPGPSNPEQYFKSAD